MSAAEETPDANLEDGGQTSSTKGSAYFQFTREMDRNTCTYNTAQIATATQARIHLNTSPVQTHCKRTAYQLEHTGRVNRVSRGTH